MATTDAKPGFRLPWSADRGESGSAADAPVTDAPVEETATPDVAQRDADRPDQENETTAMLDAAPAASDLPAGDGAVVPSEAELIAELPTTPVAAEQAAPPAPVPAVETAPAFRAAAVQPARKPNKFLADLTRAMQAAAETAKGETLARFSVDAKAHIEEIHASTATEATELRKQADDDVAAIREWSKAEIARIREETDERIAHRKSTLEREVEAHAARIEARIERVQARVTAFEAEMAAFFERLLAEDDPTRFASMAESLPEPPPFDGDEPYEPVGLIGDTPDAPAERSVILEPWPETETQTETTVDPAPAVAAESATDAPVAELPVEDAAQVDEPPAEPFEAVDPTPTDEASVATLPEPEAAATTDATTDPAASNDDDPRVALLGLTPDFAAAEAEALAFSAADAGTDEDIPVLADDALAARLNGLVPEHDEAAPAAATRLVVTGLVSVASIAGFKRHLSRVAGVRSVGVSSGPDGEFVFAVQHEPAISLKDAVATLPGFGARVTGEADGELTVSARDPETEG
jgi:hypothetical protein